MASPEEGTLQTSSLQHRKQGLVLSYPRVVQERVIEMFLRMGKDRPMEETRVTLSFLPLPEQQPLHF